MSEPTLEVHLLEMMGKRNIRTIKELSQRSGLSRKPISEVLNRNTHRMKTDTIVKLCLALECEIGDLLVLKK